MGGGAHLHKDQRKVDRGASTCGPWRNYFLEPIPWKSLETQQVRTAFGPKSPTCCSPEGVQAGEQNGLLKRVPHPEGTLGII